MDGGNIILTILGLFLAPYMIINMFIAPPTNERSSHHENKKTKR